MRAESCAVTASAVDVLVAVRDTGIGMPPEQSRRLRQLLPGRRVHHPQIYGGTGWAYAICKRWSN